MKYITLIVALLISVSVNADECRGEYYLAYKIIMDNTGQEHERLTMPESMEKYGHTPLGREFVILVYGGNGGWYQKAKPHYTANSRGTVAFATWAYTRCIQRTSR